MSRDPFYQQILEGLAGPLNPQDFEDCMADLLRELFPTLVPTHGGKDSGMDGAIADGQGEPFPLVTTTAKDVRRNLRKSINSFLTRQQPARKLVVATSRSLTPQRQFGLKDLARESGFTLIYLIEQRGVANLLYNSPRWCKQLLDLSGEPSALSVVPRSRRPLLDLEPIGRTQDIEWLRQTRSDRIISGEPGSGKTFLLYHLTRQGWGLFLVDPDGDIAGALREQNPSVIVVDDAHSQPEVLEKLRHLRQEMRMDFSIVATTWEGSRDRVIEALGGIPEDRVRHLELLTRNEILEVFRSIGVQENPDMMRYLIDQASNKPGLAATIATLWLVGSWQEVLDGRALSRTLLDFLQKWVGFEATNVLAAFSLGGDRGMGIETVREFLGFSRSKIGQITNGLAAGGVLSEIDRDTLAIWPRPLRSALIRTVFFPPKGRPRLPYRDLVEKALSLGRFAETLVEARAVGADIPQDELRAIVANAGSSRAWKALSRLTVEESQWVLEHYPDDLLTIAVDLLCQIPQTVIPRMLKRATEPIKEDAVWREKPMSILSSWVEDFTVDSLEALRRRQLMSESSEQFLREGGDRGIGVHGICIALSPSQRGSWIDPGRGDTLSEWRGMLPSEALRQIESIWEEARESIQVIDAASCHHLVSLLRDWKYQYSAGSAREAAEKGELMREFAVRILRDLVAYSQGSPGLRSAFERLAIEFGITLGLEQDPVFALLYSSSNFEFNTEQRNEREAAEREQIKTLAAKWAQDTPRVVGQRIGFYEDEARKSNNYRRNVPDLCWELASCVQQLESWLNEFLSQGLQGDLVGPFLDRIVRNRQGDWEGLLMRCLDIDSLSRRAAILVLTLENPPSPLFGKVLNEFSDLAAVVKERCQNRGIPVATLRRLLCSSQEETALAAAVGEWWAERQGEVREEVLPEWRSAILGSRVEEYSETAHAMDLKYLLGDILSKDADLALEWLRNRLCDPDRPDHFTEDSPFARALRSLRTDQRLALLPELESISKVADWISLLVRDDVEVYRQLLSIGRLSAYHLEPLGGLPQETWWSLARVAVQAGYEPAQIAEAAFAVSHTWVGSGIEYWEKWDLAFSRGGLDESSELQEIGRHGRSIAWARLKGAKGVERYIDLNGLVGGLIPSRGAR